MACEISPICDFLFGSVRTNLLMDTVDVELTVQMVKSIYTYSKDHTMESMIFTLWSKEVIPFPSLRHKIQAYQDDNRSERVLSWNNDNMFQFSAPPMVQNNPQKDGSWQNKSQMIEQIQIQPYESKKAQYPRNDND